MSHGPGAYAYEYTDAAHPNALLDALSRFYVSGAFTDVTLRCAVTGQVFRCHRAVLAARSSYFHVMFTADMKERAADAVTLRGLRAGVLEHLVRYAYTAQVRITERNVQSLLEAADLLQFASVKRACEAFLVRVLDVENCVGMCAFAERHLCRALEREARRMTLSRLPEVTQHRELLELDLPRVKTLLLGHILKEESEEKLLDAITRWIRHDVHVRVQHVGELVRAARLDLDENFYSLSDAHGELSLITEEHLKSSIRRVHASPVREHSARARNMYVIGGYYWRPLCEVHVWDPVRDTWARGRDMPDPLRESYSVSVLGADVYVSGGYRTHTVEALADVCVYDCDEDAWRRSCPMTTARYYHCSVALRGCVYALGGYRAGAPERHCEFYDPLKKQWFPVTPMIQGVGNATACVMGDKIYVTGGHYGYRGSCTYDKVQVFCSAVNEWSVIATSPHPEFGLCAVSLNSSMYLVGGQSTRVDCYCTDSDEWKDVAGMKERRMECGAVAIHGCVYVSGGYSYSKGTYLQSIEKYDPALDSWEIVGTLPGPSRSHGCVCVYSL